MPTLDTIKTRIQQLGATDALHMKEVFELPNILWQDEQLERIAKGIYEREGKKSKLNQKSLLLGKPGGILVATDQRLIFVSKGIFSGLHVEDFPYTKITSIHHTSGLTSGTITVAFSGDSSRLEGVNKAQAKDFTDFVRVKIAEARVNVAPLPSQPIPEPDVAMQIERLAKLRDQGLLTDDEFAGQKKKLLGT